LAWAYARSDFFKKSLEVSKSFKLVSNVTRFNEKGPEDNKWNAGPNFIKDFRQMVQNYPLKDKVQQMVFCGDMQRAQEKFINKGFQMHQIPKLTNEPRGFTSFIE